MQAYNSSMQEGWNFQDQLTLQNETLSQKNKIGVDMHTCNPSNWG